MVLSNDSQVMLPGAVRRDDYRYFRQRLHEEILRSQRCSHTLTLMRIFIDPADPDEVTDQLEPVLKSSIREYDLLCTVGGNDFFVAFPETNERHAETIASRIRDRFRREHWKKGETLSLEASIGIACFPHDGNNTEDLMHSADQDLKLIRSRKRQ
jgi:diguanylate cyclase (GGDEF)-like protein